MTLVQLSQQSRIDFWQLVPWIVVSLVNIGNGKRLARRATDDADGLEFFPVQVVNFREGEFRNVSLKRLRSFVILTKRADALFVVIKSDHRGKPCLFETFIQTTGATKQTQQRQIGVAIP